MTGCVSFSGSPAVPAVPAQLISDYQIGWNSGADSADAIDGDLHLDWFMSSRVVSCVVGLKYVRGRQGVPQYVDYGIGFELGPAGTNYYYIVENGVPKTGLIVRDTLLDEEFEIRRVRGLVSYYVNKIFVYTSKLRSNGTLVATGCLYSGGDSIA